MSEKTRKRIMKAAGVIMILGILAGILLPLGAQYYS